MAKPFKSRKDVDEHVYKMLSKHPVGSERNRMGFTIGRIYASVNAHDKAIEYFNNFLKVTDDSATNKLIAQSYNKSKRPEHLKALEHFQRSIQLDPKQHDVIAEACHLLLDHNAIYSNERAAFWIQLAEHQQFQDGELLSKLRMRSVAGTSAGANLERSMELQLNKELMLRPHDVSLRLRLLQQHLETKQLAEAFKYAYSTEMEEPAQCQNRDWYDLIWTLLKKLEHSQEMATGWPFWHLLLLTLERLVQLSLQSEETSSLMESLTQLYNLDLYLNKFSKLANILSINNGREMHQCCLDFYIGQFLLHAPSLMFKRAIATKKNQWSSTVRAALPLLLMGYQLHPFKEKAPNWHRHCDKVQHKLLQLWRNQTAFRCAQLGRTLLGCLKTEADDVAGMEQFESFGLWPNSDEILLTIRQQCGDLEWRVKLYDNLYTHTEHKTKEKSSQFLVDKRLQHPLYEWPKLAEIEEHERLALQLLPPILEHHVYLALGTNKLSESERVCFYEGFRHDTKERLSQCHVESLSQLDVDIFLYAVVLQVQRSLQVKRETRNSYNAPNRYETARPHMLPFANLNLSNDLVTPEQLRWWQIVVSMHKQTQLCDGSAMEQREQLKRGLQAIRGTNGVHTELFVVFELGRLLSCRDDWIHLELRIETLYKLGLSMLRRHQQQQLEPFYRFFKYANSSDTRVWLQTKHLAEDAISYLNDQYTKQNNLEDFLNEIRGIQLPMAVYMQAEAYRRLADANGTSRLTRKNFKERRLECLKATKQMLNDTPDHLLSSVVQNELRSTIAEDCYHSPDNNNLHNNSSTYEDAEDDFYAVAASSHNRSHNNRSRRQVDKDDNRSTQPPPPPPVNNLELELAVKQIVKQLSAIQDDVIGMRQDIKCNTEKVNSLEEMFKKVKISSSNNNTRSTPTQDVDDAAAAVDALGLDEFLNLEESLQQQPPNYLNGMTTSNSNAQDRFYPSTGLSPHTYNNSPMFNQNQMLQFFASQAQQYMRTPPAHPSMPPNFYGGGRPAGNYAVPPNLYPASLMDLNNYGMVATPPSLVMPQVNQPQTPVMPSLNQQQIMPPLNQQPIMPPLIQQPGVPSNVPTASGAGFFNATPFVPQPQQQQQLPQSAQFVPQQQASQQPPPVQVSLKAPQAPAAAAAPAPLVVAPPVVAAPLAPIPAVFNRALNNQPVEKEPPANVVITSSDPLPKPAVASAQPTLSVTIPPQHIKPSVVQQAQTEPTALASSDFKFSLGNNTGNMFSGLSAAFSFKSQVAQAAAEKQKELAAEAATGNNESNSDDKDKSSGGADTSAELDYDPRPDFQGIIPLPDEVQVRTGEEDEEIKFSYRARLYRHQEKEWKERGTGLIKILKNQTSGSTRILMRRDQTHKICANHQIAAGMALSTPEQDKEGKSFLWAANDFADEIVQLEKFLVRFKLAETAKEFKLAFDQAVNEASAAESQKEPKPNVFGINSFLTSTPAQSAIVLPKPMEQIRLTGGGINQPTTSTTTPDAAKSLFGGNLDYKSTTSTTTTTTTTTSTTTTNSAAASSPFAKFSFANALNATQANPVNLSFGSVCAVSDTSTNTSTAFTTAYNFGSLSVFGKPDSTLAAPAAVSAPAPQSQETESEVENFESTAQFTPLIPLPKLIDVVTGEENDLVLFEHRAKMYCFDKEEKEWRERGVGSMKLLQVNKNPQLVRLLMRRDVIHKICCNQRLLPDTEFKYLPNSNNALTWLGPDYVAEDLKFQALSVRFKTAETCKNFYDQVLKAQQAMSPNIPIQETDTNGAKPNATQGFGDAFKPKLGSWNCNDCYTSNDAAKLHCMACEAPKDDTVPAKPATLQGSGALNLTSNANKFSFGFSPASSVPTTTATTSFSFSNFGDVFKNKSVPTIAPVAPPIAAVAPAKAPVAPATAPVAQATAPVAHVTAPVAPATAPGAPATAPVAAVAAAPNTVGFGDAFKPKAGSWNCKDCYTSNDATNLYCLACEAPKDNTVPKKENMLGAGVNLTASSEKFTFGFAIPAATPASNSSGESTKTLVSTNNKIEDNVFGSSSFSFKPTTAVTSTNSIFSSTFSFSMPKGQVQQQPAAIIAGGDASYEDENHVEEEENNTYFAPVIPLPDMIDVKTGEEDDDLLYVHRAKLYRLAEEGEWKERGVGNIKILCHKTTKKLRVIMRREQVLKVCLNHWLNPTVFYKPKDEKTWMFAVHDFSEGENVLERFALRFKNAEVAQAFHKAIQMSLNGTAEPIKEEDIEATNTTPPLTTSTTTAATTTTEPVFTNELKTLANKLSLSCQFLTNQSNCSGCRGCEPDNFEYVQAASSEETPMPLPLMMPALKLPTFQQQPELSQPKDESTKSPLNRSLLKASSLTSNLNTNNSGSFGGFSTAVSANSTTTGTTSMSPNPAVVKPTIQSGGFLFGNTGTAVPVFGQSAWQLSGNTAAKPQQSIFGGSVSAATDNNKESIFANVVKPVATNKELESQSIFSQGAAPGFTFGSVAKTGLAPSFGSLAKVNTAMGKDKIKDNKENIATDPLATEPPVTKSVTTLSTPDKSVASNIFDQMATKAGDDFASLAAKSTGHPIGFQKSDSGGFFGLTHQDAFKNFPSPSTTTTSADTENNTDSVNDENYDPHYDPIIALPNEIVVSTGEENEVKVFGERATLYRFNTDTKEWKERGVGEFKILKHATLNTYRLLMRREKILKLVLNQKISATLKMEYLDASKKSFSWSSFNYAESTDGVLESLAVRFKKPELAEAFHKIVTMSIEEAKAKEIEDQKEETGN